MNLFTSLDDPTQEKLTAFIHMQEKRQHRPLREHMATWILEAIVDGNCEITGYAVNQHDSKVWTEFTFFNAFDKRDCCDGEWWENSDPGEAPGSCWECSVCQNSIGLDAGWVQFFEHCPFCGASLDTAQPEQYVMAAEEEENGEDRV